MPKKTAKQKKADAEFIAKVKSLCVVTKKSDMKAFTEALGVPEIIEHEGEKYKLKKVEQVEVEVTCRMKKVEKRSDAGEYSFAA